MTETKEKKKKGMAKCGKKIVVLLVLAMMAYGLVYAPMKQLAMTEKILNITNEESSLSLLKDDRSCKLVASQQLAQAEAEAKKAEQEVSDDDKRAFYAGIYNNCVSIAGRDYLISEEDKKAAAEASNANSAPTEETAMEKDQ